MAFSLPADEAASLCPMYVMPSASTAMCWLGASPGCLGSSSSGLHAGYSELQLSAIRGSSRAASGGSSWGYRSDWRRFRDTSEAGGPLDSPDSPEDESSLAGLAEGASTSALHAHTKTQNLGQYVSGPDAGPCPTSRLATSIAARPQPAVETNLSGATASGCR